MDESRIHIGPKIRAMFSRKIPLLVLSSERFHLLSNVFLTFSLKQGTSYTNIINYSQMKISVQKLRKLEKNSLLMSASLFTRMKNFANKFLFNFLFRIKSSSAKKNSLVSFFFAIFPPKYNSFDIIFLSLCLRTGAAC